MLPALLLFLAQWAAVTITPLALEHQVETVTPRLLAQVMPLLLLGACARVAAGKNRKGGSPRRAMEPVKAG